MSQEYALKPEAVASLAKKFKQVVRRLKKGKKINTKEAGVLIKIEEILCISVSRFALRWMHDFAVENVRRSLSEVSYSVYQWGQLGFAFDDLVLVD